MNFMVETLYLWNIQYIPTKGAYMEITTIEAKSKAVAKRLFKRDYNYYTFIKIY